ncbi:hypothetical protein HBI24_037420 [Parastagonospora nodorum]|nr:hypothetical protein HBH52_045790 [Parastagonospora nodorum]KAH4004881.1 hypothetical protein HBI10_041790 [Parastagonospora nodorum]KAH4030815.1 hypothetical protein HBI13_025240 [Parastagonospora nodorum]KAH4040451.1 hypothetical protein HBI09_028150 [Parastagonospora nodorum]KAH4071231.1 hypothetical protein HBH50_078150 [Parastagonospora nodorum]
MPSESTNGIPVIDIRLVPAGMSVEAKYRLRAQTAAAPVDGMPGMMVGMNINPSSDPEKGR